ncbi:membrane protein [Acrocarpospora corrugata]|uniref:Membrane protein n=1 Tax=Acrocarpospora corrugata TaxID=35763 RepID=A0A5M3WAE0_9ACTN|nr:hypothetical protein [Acrocarpospora corrugata]GES05864.1 membrane protein [Acrocarpospora corrugata]
MDTEAVRQSRGSVRLGHFLNTYFRSAGSPDLQTIRPALWNSVPPDAKDAAYWNLVLEQYTLYVEMADRVSARRGTANVFFLTLNTSVFTAVGVLGQNPPDGPKVLLIVPWLVLVGQCLAWFWLLRSYRQLNSAKYAVVGAIEEQLPVSPYWRAEWAALGEGKDPARYWPLSHVEQWIPFFFAVAYTAGFITLLLS